MPVSRASSSGTTLIPDSSAKTMAQLSPYGNKHIKRDFFLCYANCILYKLTVKALGTQELSYFFIKIQCEGT
jgi:hypothetical protein